MTPATKVCKGCGRTKPLDQFFREPRNRDGRQGKCLDCRYQTRRDRYRADPAAAKKHALDWKRRNRGRWQDAHRKARHGVPYGTYDAMLAEQGGGCAVCGDLPPEGKSLHIDHDHETGVIRSLLCDRCNRGLGYFRDRPDLLERAAEYLRRWKGVVPNARQVDR